MTGPLGTARLALHESEAAVRDARFAAQAAEKAHAARAGLSISEIVALGPAGLRRRAAEPRHAAAAERLLQIAEAMDFPWLDAHHRYRETGDLARRDVDQRAAAVAACEWDDCLCGAIFKPGDRGYRHCFKCNQLDRAENTVNCAICGRPHSMKFGACFGCKSDGREEAAALIRSTVLRRDGFACQMCGTDEGLMQVDHVLPISLGGSAQPWNVQTLCTWCRILKGSRYTNLDELARLELMLAYDTDLQGFLFPDEKVQLRAHLAELLGGDFSVTPMAKYATAPPDAVDEIEGLVTVLHAFDSPGVHHITHPVSEPAEPAVMQELPDACKGVVFLSTGPRPCRNKTDLLIMSLCEEGCR